MEKKKTDSKLLEQKLKAVIYCGIFGFLVLGTFQKMDIWQESKSAIEVMYAIVQSIGEGLAMMAIVAGIGFIGYLPIKLWVWQSEEKNIGFYIKLAIVYIVAVLIVGVFIGTYEPSLGRE